MSFRVNLVWCERVRDRASLAAIEVLLLGVLVLGCSDQRNDAVQPTGQGMPDASQETDSGLPQIQPSQDASLPSHDSGMEAGAPLGFDASAGNPFQPFTPLLSNTPNVRVQQEASSTFRYLRLTSSYIEWLPSGYRRWFAEIKNSNSRSWCYPELTVSLLGNGSELLWTSEGYVEAAAYQNGDMVLPVPCVGPNETVVAWAIEMEPETSFQAEDVKVIRLRFQGESLPDAVPHPAAPAVDSAEIEAITLDGGTAARVIGVLRGRAEPVSDVAVEIFAKDAEGYIFDVLRAVRDEGPLDPEEAWEFSTPEIAQPIANFRLTTEFSL
jgi:hypothetical protein